MLFDRTKVGEIVTAVAKLTSTTAVLPFSKEVDREEHDITVISVMSSYLTVISSALSKTLVSNSDVANAETEAETMKITASVNATIFFFMISLPIFQNSAHAFYRSNVVLRVVLHSSPGARQAAAARCSHSCGSSTEAGSEFHGSMQTKRTGLDRADQMRV